MKCPGVKNILSANFTQKMPFSVINIWNFMALTFIKIFAFMTANFAKNTGH
jgi:hypothetical protein